MEQVTVIDIASYILKKQGSMSAMKLQKLVYYSQAWSLVWDDVPLFSEPIEAWANGPVIRPLYDIHKGLFQVNASTFNPNALETLTPEQKETIDTVLNSYANKSAQWLSDQTHSEPPWIKARKGLNDNDRGNNQITMENMAEYYGSLH